MEYDEDILGIGDDGSIDWENLLNFDCDDDDDYCYFGDEQEKGNYDKRRNSNSNSNSEAGGAARGGGGGGVEKDKLDEEEEEEGKLTYYYYREMEKELMSNNDHLPPQQPQEEELIDNYIESFMADVLLLDSPPPPPSTGSSNQLPHHSTLNNNNNTNTHPQNHAANANANANANADDPISKKRTRQLRNRDAAVRSRERKKMYVKDLQSKARYLEAECTRLGRLLHCSYAENHALRYTLHMSNVSRAPMAKQESAVLFLELLLLGSLLWFLGITCLLIVPIKFQITPGIVLGSERNRHLENQAPREGGAEMFGVCVPSSRVKSRRCRGSRTRMKPYFAVIPILA